MRAIFSAKEGANFNGAEFISGSTSFRGATFSGVGKTNFRAVTFSGRGGQLS